MSFINWFDPLAWKWAFYLSPLFGVFMWALLRNASKDEEEGK